MFLVLEHRVASERAEFFRIDRVKRPPMIRHFEMERRTLGERGRGKASVGEIAACAVAVDDLRHLLAVPAGTLAIPFSRPSL